MKCTHCRRPIGAGEIDDSAEVRMKGPHCHDCTDDAVLDRPCPECDEVPGDGRRCQP